MTDSLITIHRVLTGQYGTFGTLSVDGLPFCVTLEDPDDGNKPNISCIPPGEYELEWRISKRFKRLHAYVKDVPGRSGIILGHGGNTHLDTEGCVLLGAAYGYKSGLPAILISTEICEKFNKRYSHIRKVRFVNAFAL